MGARKSSPLKPPPSTEPDASPPNPAFKAVDVAGEWRLQASRDLQVARDLACWGYYEWAAYAAQQAAEKAIKAVRYALTIDTQDVYESSHKLVDLSFSLLTAYEDLLPGKPWLRALTFHEADGRYPGVRVGGYRAPCTVYEQVEAFAAILTAQKVVERCDLLAADLQGFWNART